MQDSTAVDKWVAVARRLLALASARDDREVPLPLTTGADARDAADIGPDVGADEGTDGDAEGERVTAGSAAWPRAT